MVMFEWDETKNQSNFKKHKVSFSEAQLAFLDPNRLIFEDLDHSTPQETRYYCIGQVKGKPCTVRFVYRHQHIRIIGAGYWRKEKKIYEQQL